MNKSLNEYYIYIILDPRYKGRYEYMGYVFENEPIYVGKGKQNRKEFHLYNSRLESSNGNRLKNNILRKVINGGSEPIIKIIEDKLIEEKAFEIETKLIKSIGRRDQKKGTLTNLTDGGEGQSGSLSFSGEKNPFYGKKHNPESFKNVSKPIQQLDLDGNIIRNYYSIEEAARRTNSIPCKISTCAKGKRKTHNKYKWKYLNEEDNKSVNTGNKTKFKFILQKNTNGEVINKWDKIKDILKFNTSYKKTDIINCLKGRYPSYKGYLWEYKI